MPTAHHPPAATRYEEKQHRRQKKWEKMSADQQQAYYDHIDGIREQREKESVKKNREELRRAEAMTRAMNEGRSCWENMAPEQLQPEAVRRGLNVRGKRTAAELAELLVEDDRKRAEKEASKNAGKAERREREQAAHQAKKEKVEAYARKRAAEQDRLRAAAEAAQRAAAPKPTAEELAWFRARDQEAFERTVARREQAQREEEDKLKRLKKLRSQVKVNVRRDPSRLTRPTASSAARKQDTSTSGGQMHVRAPPRLATPAWRKGM